MATTTVLKKPQILGRAKNMHDIIVQVPENDRLGVYSIYFNDDPILLAAQEARESDEIFENYDDLLHDLTH